MPLCARCTGILFGQLFSVPFAVLYHDVSPLVLLILVFPLILDGVVQYVTNYESTNLRRLLTGIMYGIGMVLFIAKTIYTFLILTKLI